MKAIIITIAMSLGLPAMAQNAPAPIIIVATPQAVPMIPMAWPTPPQVFAPIVQPVYGPYAPIPYTFQSSGYAVPYGAPGWVGF